MCELLGLCFNLPMRPTFSFKKFFQASEDNPDGWGLAFYPDESSQVFKEPLPVRKSDLFAFLLNFKRIESRIFVGHVRKTSGSAVCYKNTHPFSRELNGHDFVFAHNGDLKNFRSLPLGPFRPIGDTDSEHAFCHILEYIEARGIKAWNKESYGWMAEKFKQINALGNFNCLLTDGTRLFCYTDKIGYKPLYYLRRISPFAEPPEEEEGEHVARDGANDLNQFGYIVSSIPLTDEDGWIRFNPGELVVFANGTIDFSSE